MTVVNSAGQVNKLLENSEKLYLGGGRPPPKKGYKRIFNTPVGPYPKLIDVALKYNMYKSNIYRRYTKTTEAFKDWYVIQNPTEEQSREALANVNAMFTAKYEAEDNCPLCNAIDDLLFPENCWLLTVIHNHGSAGTEGVRIRYLYRKKEFRVSYTDWTNGERPHLK